MNRKARSFFRSKLQKSNVDVVCLFHSGIQEVTGASSPVITHALQEVLFSMFSKDPDQSLPCLGQASESREGDHATSQCHEKERTEKKEKRTHENTAPKSSSPSELGMALSRCFRFITEHSEMLE